MLFERRWQIQVLVYCMHKYVLYKYVFFHLKALVLQAKASAEVLMLGSVEADIQER